ncbi:unnamed protein product, partial [Prorocentrum cordatum]
RVFPPRAPRRVAEVADQPDEGDSSSSSASSPPDASGSDSPLSSLSDSDAGVFDAGSWHEGLLARIGNLQMKAAWDTVAALQAISRKRPSSLEDDDTFVQEAGLLEVDHGTEGRQMSKARADIDREIDEAQLRTCSWVGRFADSLQHTARSIEDHARRRPKKAGFSFDNMRGEEPQVLGAARPGREGPRAGVVAESGAKAADRGGRPPEAHLRAAEPNRFPAGERQPREERARPALQGARVRVEYAGDRCRGGPVRRDQERGHGAATGRAAPPEPAAAGEPRGAVGGELGFRAPQELPGDRRGLHGRRGHQGLAVLRGLPAARGAGPRRPDAAGPRRRGAAGRRRRGGRRGGGRRGGGRGGGGCAGGPPASGAGGPRGAARAGAGRGRGAAGHGGGEGAAAGGPGGGGGDLGAPGGARAPGRIGAPPQPSPARGRPCSAAPAREQAAAAGEPAVGGSRPVSAQEGAVAGASGEYNACAGEIAAALAGRPPESAGAGQEVIAQQLLELERMEAARRRLQTTWVRLRSQSAAFSLAGGGKEPQQYQPRLQRAAWQGAESAQAPSRCEPGGPAGREGRGGAGAVGGGAAGELEPQATTLGVKTLQRSALRGESGDPLRRDAISFGSEFQGLLGGDLALGTGDKLWERRRKSMAERLRRLSEIQGPPEMISQLLKKQGENIQLSTQLRNYEYLINKMRKNIPLTNRDLRLIEAMLNLDDCGNAELKEDVAAARRRVRHLQRVLREKRQAWRSTDGVMQLPRGKSVKVLTHASREQERVGAAKATSAAQWLAGRGGAGPAAAPGAPRPGARGAGEVLRTLRGLSPSPASVVERRRGGRGSAGHRSDVDHLFPRRGDHGGEHP